MSTIDVEAIAQVLAPYEDVWIFSDEPYASLAFDGGASPAAHPAPGRAHPSGRRRFQDLRHARMAHRLGDPPRARADPGALGDQHGVLRPHLSQWAVVEALNGLAARRARHARRLRAPPRRRGPGARSHTGDPLPRRGRVLRLAQRDRAVPSRGARDSEALRRRPLDEAGVALLGRPLRPADSGRGRASAALVRGVAAGSRRRSAPHRRLLRARWSPRARRRWRPASP